jgi:hypothetical protein
MLLKASASILTIFKQYFCENPSQLGRFGVFVSQTKQDVMLPNISVKEIMKDKKKVIFWIWTT